MPSAFQSRRVAHLKQALGTLSVKKVSKKYVREQIIAGTIGLLVGLSVTQLWTEQNRQREREKWVAQELKEARTIKAGMSAAELMKVFELDGGLIPAPPGTPTSHPHWFDG